MANEETRQSDERFERQVTDQNTIIECNSSQDCPRGSGQTCVDGQCVDTVTSSFISNEKPDDSSIQPVVPDGFSKPDAIDTGDFSALPPVKECRSDRDCPPGQNCLDGKCTSSFDQPVFENWWELTDEYRYLGNLISPIIERTDELDFYDNPRKIQWYPIEVCANGEVVCEQLNRMLADKNKSVRDVSLNRLLSPQVRNSCPIGPIYFDPRDEQTYAFGTEEVGSHPKGCIRQNYGDDSIGSYGDIGCCDSILDVYPMDQAYSLDLHNCYFVDGDLMYHCGGCSCPTTPNSFATVIPAYHYDDNPVNWGFTSAYASFSGNAPADNFGYDLMVYGGPVDETKDITDISSALAGTHGSALSIGPSCPDLMCVGGTYNGMYCDETQLYGVSEADCMSGSPSEAGRCVMGSGCSWGVKKPEAYLTSGWNGNDYSCCPGCVNPESNDPSCDNDYNQTTRDEQNWGQNGAGWSFDQYNFYQPDWSLGPGSDWAVSDANFQQWVHGVCGEVYGDVCIAGTFFGDDGGSGGRFSCPSDCQGDTWGFDGNWDAPQEGTCYTSDDNSFSGCCAWDDIRQTCTYRGCNSYKDCVDSFSAYFSINGCEENCQSQILMSSTTIPHYVGSSGGLTDTQYDLCENDSDGDGLCDSGDEYSDCPQSSDGGTYFDCEGVCCVNGETYVNGNLSGVDCKVIDDCGECNLPEDVNRLDLGCGCPGDGINFGFEVSTWYFDNDGDGLGDPDITLDLCFQGGNGCDTSGNGESNATSEGDVCSTSNMILTDKTIYDSYLTVGSCNTPGGYCPSTNGEDVDLTYDSDGSAGDATITISGDDCRSNTVGCNGCCSNDQETYPELPLCGQWDTCNNCVVIEDACVQATDGSVTCPNLNAGDIDLNENQVYIGGCDGICCGGPGIDTLLDYQGTLTYADCAYVDYFWIDNDGDMLGDSQGTATPICQKDGVHLDDSLSSCNLGTLGGYCSNNLDTDDECWCPDIAPFNNDLTIAGNCKDCNGECIPNNISGNGQIGCPDSDGDGYWDANNSTSGCAQYDRNGFECTGDDCTGDECPENYCTAGYSGVAPCVQGCDGVYYKDGTTSVDVCGGKGVIDDCGVCGGQCCAASECPGDDCPDGCGECGCSDVSTLCLNDDLGLADCETYSFLGSTEPGYYCSCTGGIVNECGECSTDQGVQEFYYCTDEGGCSDGERFCPDGSVNPNNLQLVGDCAVLDGCGVCDGDAPAGGYPCPTSNLDFGEPCNLGSDTYCGDPLDGDGNDCPKIDGCGVCNGSISESGIRCSDYSDSNHFTSAIVSGANIDITYGDYCSTTEYYCNPTFGDLSDANTMCISIFDCAGNCKGFINSVECPEGYFESVHGGCWENGSAVIDECGNCTGPGTECTGGSEDPGVYLDNDGIPIYDIDGNETGALDCATLGQQGECCYNYADKGCGCGGNPSTTHYIDTDGDTKPDPVGEGFYDDGPRQYCLQYGGGPVTTYTVYQTIGDSGDLSCGNPGGWCAQTPVDWDAPLQFEQQGGNLEWFAMWNCPCNRVDCDGNCCYDPNEAENGICVDAGNSTWSGGNQTGNHCKNLDDCLTCRYPEGHALYNNDWNGLDEGCGCGDGPPLDYWQDLDNDGLGEGEPSQYCEDNVPDGYVSNNFDMAPDCFSNFADCNGDCAPLPPDFDCAAQGCGYHISNETTDVLNSAAGTTNFLTDADPDCFSEQPGCAINDICGRCTGGLTECNEYNQPEEGGGYDCLPCVPDCSTSSGECDGTWMYNQCWGGTAFLDDCGICSGGGTGHIANAELDCNGSCPPTQMNLGYGNSYAEGEYPHYIDDCGICIAANATSNIDCNGDCCTGPCDGDDAYTDNCERCVGGDTSLDPCMPDCSESEEECDGFWVDGQCFGGTASMDNCHICSGGGTGNIPDATDLGCGCGVGAAQLHYYDQDGDRVPNEPYNPYAPIDYCAVRNGNCNPGDTTADGEPSCVNGENAFWNPGITQIPLVPCPNPTLADDGEPIECYTCGNIGGWCTYDSNNPLPGGNPWDIMPGCPCNTRQCGTGDCCVELAGGGECEGHAQSRGLGLDNDDFWPQCLPDDACGNCGGGCVCSGTMDYPGGTCVGGDITCGDPIPPGENTLTVGCGQTCMENPPQNDDCGDCGGTCFNPVDYGEEQPEGCKECGCDSVAELHCDAGDADCNTNSYVGSVIPGAYCSCTGEMVDCCGNCGGGCLSAGGDCVSNPPDDIIMCDDDENNINLADCFGVCVNNGGDLTCYDTINECSDDIGTDSCGICHGQGPIYSCADNWNDAGAGGSGPCPGSTPNEGFQLCFHELDGCTAPDECGNCGGDCQDLGDGYIQCGSSSNNDVVADCKGICGGDATYDNCGFCDGPYIDGIGADCNTANDVNGDDGPIIYCAVPDDPAHQYYCPICTEEDGTCGDDSNDLYGVYNGGACGELNLCGECVVNGHGTNPSGSTIGYVLSDGEPCQGSSENHPHQGEICGCPRDDGYQVAVCDDCGFCYPPDHPDFNSKCTGCPDEVESCPDSNGGDYLPCNGNLNSAGESCQYWDSNECTINGGNCFCPLGITECYQDSDGDGDYNLPVDIDLECNGTGRYECDTTPLCSSCNSADGECCTSPEGDEICDIPCSSIQTFSTGCMDNFTPSTGGPFTAPGSDDGYGDGACNYNFYADPEGSGACEDMGNIEHEHNIEPCCSYPGDPGFTCPDWGFDCIPTLKNTGAYSGVTQCTPGTTQTSWNYFYPDVPNETVEMSEAWCFNKIDDSCDCEFGPAAVRYYCEQTQGLQCRYIERDEFGDDHQAVDGVFEGCSYYDNAYFNEPCELVKPCGGDGGDCTHGGSCTGWGKHCGTLSTGGYIISDTVTPSLGCNETVNGCFDVPMECVAQGGDYCSTGPGTTYTNPDSQPAHCVPGQTNQGAYQPFYDNWVACASDGSNQPVEPPSCQIQGYDCGNAVDCKGTGCYNLTSDNCSCEDGEGAVYHECFGSGLDGCSVSGCSLLSHSEYCVTELTSCGNMGSTGNCNPWVDGVQEDYPFDCNGTGCYNPTSGCDCNTPEGSTSHDCNLGCGNTDSLLGDTGDNGCWVGGCEPNYYCPDNQCAWDGESSNGLGGQAQDCVLGECFTPNGECDCSAGPDGVWIDPESCLPNCGGGGCVGGFGTGTECEQPPTCQDLGYSCGPFDGNGSSNTVPLSNCGLDVGDIDGDGIPECYNFSAFDNLDVQLDYVMNCSCDNPVYCECANACDGDGCYPYGTVCSEVCEQPLPCSEYNSGNCTQGICTDANGNSVGCDCNGQGCVTDSMSLDGAVDSVCCSHCFDDNACDYIQCFNDDLSHPHWPNESGCGPSGCWGGNFGNPCEYADSGNPELGYSMMTCDDFNFDCTGWHPNIPALPAQPDPDGWVWYQGDSTIWIDNGGFPLCPGQVMNDTLAEINWSVEEQGDVSGYPICYNLDPIYAEWEECGCDDGPGARRCNLGWCDLVCAELTKEECQLIDFHDHDHSPGNVGCYWSETSPRGCRSYERNYLTTTECNEINGIGECGSGVPDGQECNYCICDMHWNSNCTQSQSPADYCSENCRDNDDTCGGFGSGCHCSIDSFFGGGVGPEQLADPNNEGLYSGMCPPGYAWSNEQGECVWQGGSTELE